MSNGREASNIFSMLLNELAANLLTPCNFCVSVLPVGKHWSVPQIVETETCVSDNVQTYVCGSHYT